MGLNILITGAYGFIGKHVVNMLSQSFDRVVGIVRKTDAQDTTQSQVTLVSCDLSYYDRLLKILNEYEITLVVHCATKRLSNEEHGHQMDIYQNNIGSMINICKASCNSSVKKIVHLSSYGVFDIRKFDKQPYKETDHPSPGDYYGLIKLQEESILTYYVSQKPSLSAVILRLPGVFGPGKNSGVVYSFIRNALNHEPMYIAEPNSLFRMAYIDDVLVSLMQIIRAPNFNEALTIFHITSKSIFSLSLLAEKIKKIAGSASPVYLEKSDYAQCLLLDNRKISEVLNITSHCLNKSLLEYMSFIKDASTDSKITFN